VRFQKCVQSLLILLGTLSWGNSYGQKSSGSMLGSRATKLRVMGLVAGRALTEHAVLLEVILENPTSLKKNSLDSLSESEFSRAFEKVVTQRMIIEDLKILGDGLSSQDLVNDELKRLKTTLGSKVYAQVLKDFEITEQNLRERISQRLQVERALQEKVNLAVNTQGDKQDKASRESIAKKAIEEWLGQLKSRYRIQIFRTDD